MIYLSLHPIRITPKIVCQNPRMGRVDARLFRIKFYEVFEYNIFKLLNFYTRKSFLLLIRTIQNNTFSRLITISVVHYIYLNLGVLRLFHTGVKREMFMDFFTIVKKNVLIAWNSNVLPVFIINLCTPR